MTYHELVEQAREVFGKADVSGIEGHVAYQFNITGEAAGAFYLEISDGKVNVEPYEYYDRDVLFTTTAETLLKIAEGKLDPLWAVTTGKIKFEGSVEKALLMKKISASVDADGEAPAEEKKEETAHTEAPAEEQLEHVEAAPAEEKKASVPNTVIGRKWPNRGKKKR